MAFDDIPYALNNVRDIEPGVNGIELNPNARCADAVEQAYAFFSELGPYADDLGPKQRHAQASGTAWKPNPTVGGFGVKLAGSTGYFAATGHQLRPWSRECLFVYGASGTQGISTMDEVPGSGTYDRTLYVNSSNLIAAYTWDGGPQTAVGTTVLTVGQAYHAIATCSNSLLSIYLNGVLEGSIAVSNAGYQGYATPELVFGYGGPAPSTANTLLYHVEYNSVLSAADVMHRYLNQMEMFRVKDAQLPVGVAAAGGITGTLAATEANDTVAAAGTLPIAGAGAITEAGDTLSSEGTLPIAGSANISEASDTSSAAGTLALAGAASITEGSDTLTAGSALTIAATLAVTEESDTLAATGGSGTTGSLAVTEADDTAAGAGVLPITGSATVTGASDTLAAAGVLPIAGAAAITEDSDSIVSTGALAITGTANITESGDTLSTSTAAEVNAIVFRVSAEPCTFRIAAEPCTFRIAAEPCTFRIAA